MKLPAVERRYEMVPHPDGTLVIDDMQNVLAPGAPPCFNILRARTGYHVGKTAGAAPQTLNVAMMSVVPAHRNILLRRPGPVKGISPAIYGPTAPSPGRNFRRSFRLNNTPFYRMIGPYYPIFVFEEAQ